MGRQGDIITIKRDDFSRKRDYKKNVDQAQVPNNTTAELTTVTYNKFDDSDYLMEFESREETMKEILKVLKDDNISLVTLYGMGGTGKTTLAKQVGKRAKELNMFDLVMFVYVSTTTRRVERIQGAIADQLGLVLEGDQYDLDSRQRQISKKFGKMGERVLIIMDDTWRKLDLKKTGILGDDGSRMGCKVLLTSRSREVGYLMGGQRFYNLLLLTDEEGLLLLIKFAGIGYKYPWDLISVAREVAKLCQGLPLAISLIGSTLRGKTVDQWLQVLETLQSLKGNNLDYLVVKTIWLCYDALDSKVAKTIFSICGLFPKYREILIDDLFQYAVRLGLCSSEKELGTAINTLRDSGLLIMHSGTCSKDHVIIMHDFIRAFATSKVLTENPAYSDSISKYRRALRDEEDFEWREELDRLLRLMYGAKKSKHYPSYSSSKTSNGGSRGHELQVITGSSSYREVAAACTIPKPSGKLVDFHGLCRVDKSFLPMLKEACAMNPNLKESQRKHSEIVRHTAFDSLGRLLFLLANVRIRDLVHHKHDLRKLWDQVKLMEFDVQWLSPAVDRVLSNSPEVTRIEALRKKSDKLWQQLKIVENQIALAESKLDGFPIAEVSEALLVSKVAPPWRKTLFRKSKLS